MRFKRNDNNKKSVANPSLFSMIFIPIAGLANDIPKDKGEPIEQVIERIEVTSTKRDEFIRDISGSISAITENTLSAYGLDSVSGVIDRVPGISFTQPIKNRATFNIRGINTDIGETQLTQDPVGFYVNDMQLMGAYAEIVQPDISLYDVNRVEVLRGPQGTLYGAGKIGGAVRVITNQPNAQKIELSIRSDFADTDEGGTRQRYDAMLNVPLINNELAIRVVGSYRDDEGWIKNITLDTDNTYQDTHLRAAVLWQPDMQWQVLFDALFFDSEGDDGDSYDSNLGKFNSASPIPVTRDYNMDVYNFVVDYDYSDVFTLTSSTNYRDSSANWHSYIGPFDGIGEFVNQSGPLSSESFSQELRAVSGPATQIDWILGLYYYDTQLSGPLTFNVLGLKIFADFIVPNVIDSDLLFGAFMDYQMTEQAIFFDTTFPLTDSWSITLGARYFETDTDYRQLEQQGFDFDAFGVIPFDDVRNQVDDDGTMWRAIATYQPDEYSHYYISASKGVRAAQANPNYGPSFSDPDDVFIEQDYQQDKLYTYEVGAKLTWLSGNLQTNIALYTIDWRDIQVDALRASDVSNYIANAGDAVSNGAEIEVQAVINTQLNGYFSAAWQDAEIDNISQEQSFLSGALDKDKLPGTPDTMYNIGLTYQAEVFHAVMLTANVNGSYVDDSVNRFSNASGLGIANSDFAVNDSYTKVDAAVSLNFSTWTTTFYVENLTNHDDAILNIGQTMPNPMISLRPRTMGIRIQYQL